MNLEKSSFESGLAAPWGNQRQHASVSGISTALGVKAPRNHPVSSEKATSLAVRTLLRRAESDLGSKKLFIDVSPLDIFFLARITDSVSRHK